MAAKDNFFYSKKTLKIRGKVVDTSDPKVMGIINLTPDSFYKISRKSSEKILLESVEKMIIDGVDIIDLGAFSTRPDYETISEEEEWLRLKGGLESIKTEFPEVVISIDTFRSGIAKNAVNSGADIINDISGGQGDEKMFEVISQLNVPYILMHIQGAPANMHSNTHYDSMLKEIAVFFDKQIKRLHALGHNDIIIDPGIGFSKTIAQNYEILKNLDYFKVFNVPVLIGISRKSLIFKPLQISPEEALNGTTVLNTLAIMKGASILRVHDPKEAKEVINILKQLPH